MFFSYKGGNENNRKWFETALGVILAAQQFKIEKDGDVFITQVIGLTNDDEVSKEFCPFKQLIERLNHTLRETYRNTFGYKTDDGAALDGTPNQCYNAVKQTEKLTVLEFFAVGKTFRALF